jgi:hypothetical protein
MLRICETLDLISCSCAWSEATRGAFLIQASFRALFLFGPQTKSKICSSSAHNGLALSSWTVMESVQLGTSFNWCLWMALQSSWSRCVTSRDMIISCDRARTCIGASFHSWISRSTINDVLKDTSMVPRTEAMADSGSVIVRRRWTRLGAGLNARKNGALKIILLRRLYAWCALQSAYERIRKLDLAYRGVDFAYLSGSELFRFTRQIGYWPIN